MAWYYKCVFTLIAINKRRTVMTLRCLVLTVSQRKHWYYKSLSTRCGSGQVCQRSALCTLASQPVTRCQVSRDLDILFPPGAKMFTGSGVEYRGYKIIYVRYLDNSMEAFKGLKSYLVVSTPFLSHSWVSCLNGHTHSPLLEVGRLRTILRTLWWPLRFPHETFIQQVIFKFLKRTYFQKVWNLNAQ